MAHSGNPLAVKHHGEAEDVIEVTFLDKKIFDSDLIERIGFALYALVRDDGPNRIILNFEGVEHSSSSVIAKYIGLHQRVANRGGKLLLCNLNQAHLELFRLTRLNRMFKIVVSLEAALNEMN